MNPSGEQENEERAKLCLLILSGRSIPLDAEAMQARTCLKMRTLYSIVLYLLTPFVLLRMVWLGMKNPGYLSGWTQRLGLSAPNPDGRPVIWIHAVSVGEVQAAVPLANGLVRDQPTYRILLTTITPTGAAIVKRRFGDRVTHCYLPYDLPHAVSRFIRKLTPRILLVIETEIWPNLFHYCGVNGIRVLLVNARMSRRSFNGYKRFGRFTRQVLSLLTVIAAQTGQDRQRYISLGANPDKVSVTGNMKFDVSVPQSVAEEAQSLRRFLSVNRPVWIAASTHDGEEKMVLDAHRSILEKHPECLLILAPRHPERFGDVAGLSARYGFKTVCKSRAAEYNTDTAVYVLDTLGELMIYYAASDVAFVGGSLLPCGGHNVLEPSSLGIPVVTGKFVTNFTEINELLLNEGGSVMISSVDELIECINGLLADGNMRHIMGQAGREIVARNKGSTARILQLIRENIPA